MISSAMVVCTFLAYTHGLRTVCYYSNIAQYRPGIGMFKPENVDPKMCTHLVYSFVKVAGLDLKPTQYNDDNIGLTQGMYGRMVNLKKVNKDLKLLLAVGGFMDEAKTFASAWNTNKSREIFAKNLVRYVRNISFDGVQLEWANIVGWYNPLYNKWNMLLLLKEIRAEFGKESVRTRKTRLILAVTLPAKKREIDQLHNIPEIVKQSDFVSIRAFDLRTAKDRKVGLSSAFFADPKSKGTEKTLNFDWVARYYLSMKLPRDKLNMGISTFGRSFQLKDERNNRIGDAALDYGFFGPWSAMTGLLGRYEMCQFIWEGGSVVNVPSQHARYYVTGSQWISYEDNLSVAQKACFIKKHGFGGITFWSLDLDDFTGKGCREGQFPLINTVLHVMKSKDWRTCALRPNPKKYLKALYLNRTYVPKEFPPGRKRVVCYIQSWACHRRGKGKFVPENIDPHICTHIIYAYVLIKEINLVPFMRNDESEPWREGMYERLTNARVANPQLKILIGVGGGVNSQYVKSLPNHGNSLRTFANNVVAFLRERNFDGIELTWEVPTKELVPRYMGFFKALHRAFEVDKVISGKPRLILSISLPAGKPKIDAYGRNLREIQQAVDFISVMTYDFHGSWERYTGFNSPMYSDDVEKGERKQLNLDWVRRYMLTLKLLRHKINLGIPTYGRSFTLKDQDFDLVYDPVIGGGTPGQFTGTRGLLAYYEVCDFLVHGAEKVWAINQRVPYATLDTQWVSYDDKDSVILKACYIQEVGYGGANIWSLDMDDFTGISCDKGKFPLVATVFDIMRGANNPYCKKTISEVYDPDSGVGPRRLSAFK